MYDDFQRFQLIHRPICNLVDQALGLGVGGLLLPPLLVLLTFDAVLLHSGRSTVSWVKVTVIKKVLGEKQRLSNKLHFTENMSERLIVKWRQSYGCLEEREGVMQNKIEESLIFTQNFKDGIVRFKKFEDFNKVIFLIQKLQIVIRRYNVGFS